MRTTSRDCDRRTYGSSLIFIGSAKSADPGAEVAPKNGKLPGAVIRQTCEKATAYYLMCRLSPQMIL